MSYTNILQLKDNDNNASLQTLYGDVRYCKNKYDYLISSSEYMCYKYGIHLKKKEHIVK